MKNYFQESNVSQDTIARIFDDNEFSEIKNSNTTGEKSIFVFSPLHLEGVDAQWALMSVTEYDIFVGKALDLLEVQGSILRLLRLIGRTICDVGNRV